MSDGRPAPDRGQPSGTVTLVFTDIEGSTRLLDELGVDAYRDALAEHRRIVREACARHAGYEVDYEGDAFFYAFASAQAAVNAVCEAMTGLDGGPIRIRVGIHTGEPALDPPKYVGLDVHRAARIMAAAHGGQVALSRETVELLDGAVELKDLGEHRFKDLAAPERVYQLGTHDSPRLKSLYRVTLPTPTTPFLGRDRELAAVVERLTTPETRLLTLTGPGGTGKTRLALQAAAECSDEFPDGVYWIPLAPHRDGRVVMTAVARALELRVQPGSTPLETVAEALVDKAPLLVCDNAEHLLPAVATDLAALAGRCPGLKLLVTSRERLHVAIEHTWPVPQLSASDGERLFVDRARRAGVSVEGDPVVGELCHRLDQLPLAIELAAARTVVFEPEQLLTRLERLDALWGPADADPRQRTLRATIDWSYALLGDEEQRVLRALSVFAGGCTLEAAEWVAVADAETLRSLLDKSLVRRLSTERASRFWLLETIREYAAERLEESGEAERVRGRLLAWLDDFTRRAEPALKGDEDQAGWFQDIALELPNLRVGHDHALHVCDVRALEGPTRLGLWCDLCAVPEGLDWFERALAANLRGPLYARALVWTGLLTLRTGNYERAEALTRAALDVARAQGDLWAEAWGLTTLANSRWMQEGLSGARDGWLAALKVARTAGDPWLEQAIEANLATLVTAEEAERAGVRDMDRVAQAARDRGDSFMRAFIDVARGEQAGWAHHDWDLADRYLGDAEAAFRDFGTWWWLVAAGPRMVALVELGRVEDARLLGVSTLRHAAQNLHLEPRTLLELLVGAAATLSLLGRHEPAATLVGAAAGVLGESIGPNPDVASYLCRVEERVKSVLPPPRFGMLYAEGRGARASDVLATATEALSNQP